MNRVVIGRCSICGGSVEAHHGGWWGICPPPPPTCTQCGAVEAASVGPIIPMVPAGSYPARTTTDNGITFAKLASRVGDL